MKLPPGFELEEETKKALPVGPRNPLQSPVEGLVMGALKGLGKTALGAGKLVKSAGGFGELSPEDQAAFDPATWGMNPQGTMEQIGHGAERIGEFAAGGAAMKLPKAASVLGSMAKLGTEAAAVSSVQQGSIPEGVVTGAAASLLPPALTAISKVSPKILAEGAANYVTGGKYKLAMSMLDKVLTKGAMPSEAAAAGYSEAQWQATVKAAQQEVRMMEAAEKEAAKAAKAAEKAAEKIKPGTTTPENWPDREAAADAISKSRMEAMPKAIAPATEALKKRLVDNIERKVVEWHEAGVPKNEIIARVKGFKGLPPNKAEGAVDLVFETKELKPITPEPTTEPNIIKDLAKSEDMRAVARSLWNQGLTKEKATKVLLSKGVQPGYAFALLKGLYK